MVDRIRWDTVSYLPFYYVFFQFLLLTIFNLQANILTTKDILSNLELLWLEDLLFGGGGSDLEPRIILGYSTTVLTEEDRYAYLNRRKQFSHERNFLLLRLNKNM